ncbi:hypothetical protein MC885_013811 [Smutsia gigantea]|nr:hypothetical protein MC885_013811 [Smutsia gigantea]
MAKEGVEKAEETEQMIEKEAGKEPAEGGGGGGSHRLGDAQEMRAVVLAGFGGLNKLRVTRKAMPEPQDGELKIRVKACGLNFLDLMVRQGNIDNPPKTPLVPGFECSGIVEALGDSVKGYEIPDDMSFSEAAAFPMNFVTAYMMLFEVANLREGMCVLVHSAGGGVSHFLEQRGMYRGHAVCSIEFNVTDRGKTSGKAHSHVCKHSTKPGRGDTVLQQLGNSKESPEHSTAPPVEGLLVSLCYCFYIALPVSSTAAFLMALGSLTQITAANNWRPVQRPLSSVSSTCSRSDFPTYQAALFPPCLSSTETPFVVRIKSLVSLTPWHEWPLVSLSLSLCGHFLLFLLFQQYRRTCSFHSQHSERPARRGCLHPMLQRQGARPTSLLLKTSDAGHRCLDSSRELRTTWGCPGAKGSSGRGEDLPLTQPTSQGVGKFNIEAALDVGCLAEIQAQATTKAGWDEKSVQLEKSETQSKRQPRLFSRTPKLSATALGPQLPRWPLVLLLCPACR